MITLPLQATAFADKMLTWYDRNHRILPWREDPTPYHVWLSEIMLQQTQVQTVIPYYERFLSACPTIYSLATIDSDRLHKLWEGLGYYSRAKNLQKCAKLLVAEYECMLPDSYERLLSLPGIGPYTAGAIASIAFGERVCAVDGNVLRILSRLCAYDAPINVESFAKPLKLLAQSLVPGHRPGDFNQALMDLGALVCRANGTPICSDCPFSDYCAANKKHIVTLLPIKRAKKPRDLQWHNIILLVYNNTVWIHKRPDHGLLASLWEFMDIEGEYNSDEIKNHLTSLGMNVSSIEALGAHKHLFTHIEWRMQGWLVRLNHRPSLPDGQWVFVSELTSTYATAGAISFYRNQLLNQQLL